MSFPTIKALKSLRDEEDTCSDPNQKHTIESKNWSKTMESLQEWMSLHLVISKETLSYVTRVEMDNYHPILNDLTSHDYVGINDHSKVNTILKVIEILKLDAVKLIILVSNALWFNFGGYVTLYTDFLVQNEEVTGEYTKNISEFPQG